MLSELIEWLDSGIASTVSAATLDSTAAYLAIYESALRGDRVDWPLGDQPTFPLAAHGRAGGQQQHVDVDQSARPEAANHHLPGTCLRAHSSAGSEPLSA